MTALDFAKYWKSQGKDPMDGYKPLSQERMAEYTECIRKLEDPAAVLAQARCPPCTMHPPGRPRAPL
jgi:hypothetical protein